MHAPEEKGMTARDWNRNQEKITRLRDLAAAVSGKMFFGVLLLVVCILCQQGVRGKPGGSSSLILAKPFLFRTRKSRPTESPSFTFYRA